MHASTKCYWPMAALWSEVNCMAVHQVIFDYHCHTQVRCSQRPQHAGFEKTGVKSCRSWTLAKSVEQVLDTWCISGCQFLLGWREEGWWRGTRWREKNAGRCTSGTASLHQWTPLWSRTKRCRLEKKKKQSLTEDATQGHKERGSTPPARSFLASTKG